ATWAKIVDYPLGIYSRVKALDGDPDVFGKVYVALEGKGFAYGVAAAGQAPSAYNDSYQTSKDTPLHVDAPGVLANDTDPQQDPLTAILVSDVSHGSLTLNSNGSFDYTPTGGYDGEDNFTYKANDGTNDSNVATVTITVVGPVKDVANADIPVSGAVSGSYTDTQATDDTYESITEVESGGKPADRHSYLEHKWTIDVTGGDPVTFYVEAYHTANSENDDFVFAYSTDNVNYTDMVTVVKTSDDDSYQNFSLPNGTSGAVYIRVVDTDQTKGNRSLDTVYVDHMYIESGGQAPQAPTANDDSYQTDEDTELNVQAPGVLGNDTDPQEDPLTAILVSDVSNGTLTLYSNGAFDYTPDTGFTGDDTFTYKANDGENDSNVATVTITVNPEQQADATIAKTTTAPTIDGTVDSIWSSATSYSIANLIVGRVKDPADLSGTWRALWDSDNIYFLVEVTDADLVNDSTEPYDDDCVEIYLDPDNSKGTSYDGVNDYQLLFRWNDATIHVGGNSCTDTTGMDFAIVDTANGYRFEASFPWSTLGVTPVAGNMVGVDAAMDDDDKNRNRDAQMMWHDTTGDGWTDPSVFGTAELGS
ncbi:MAG: cadherin-like domain-containing protein, partial [Planctomycetes bacterium]|nr:cadherin-like domain-containing protein [Planctomycetota bacterium]